MVTFLRSLKVPVHVCHFPLLPSATEVHQDSPQLQSIYSTGKLKIMHFLNRLCRALLPTLIIMKVRVSLSDYSQNNNNNNYSQISQLMVLVVESICTPNSLRQLNKESTCCMHVHTMFSHVPNLFSISHEKNWEGLVHLVHVIITTSCPSP